jgi:hypothetical protein
MSLTRSAVLEVGAATAATRTSGDQHTPAGARGVYLRVQIGTLTGSPTFTATIKRKALDASYDTVWTAASALNTATTGIYLLYPGVTDGNVTEADGIPIPQVWQLVLTYGGTGSALTTEAEVDYIF